MRKTMSVRKEILCALFSICVSAALCLDMTEADLRHIPLSVKNILAATPEFFRNTYGSLNMKSFSVLAVALFFLNRRIDDFCKEKRRGGLLTYFINALLACIWLLAEGFCVSDDVVMLFSTTGQKLKSFLYVSGIFFGLNYLTKWLDCFFQTQCEPAPKRAPSRFQKHPFLFSFFGLLLLWSPHFLFAYPGTVTLDALDQLKQFFGWRVWNTHHPPLFGLLSGSVIRLGSAISGNAGLYLFLLLQTLTSAAVLSYGFRVMLELDAPRWLSRLCAFAFITSPYYANTITILLKDNIYAICFLLMMIELTFMERRGDAYFEDTRHVYLYGVAVAGVFLFRNDGKYILVPMTILLTSLWRTRTRKAFLRVLACLVLPVVFAGVLNALITISLDAKKGSVREALSLPIQQTARYVKYYGDEVTEEEKAAINAVLDYDNLAELYDPSISDPVKSTFHAASNSDLLDYLKVWARMFCKHPSVYVLASMNQNYYLFFPFVPNDSAMGSFHRTYYDDELINLLNLHEVPALERPNYFVFLLDNLYFFVPFLGWLANPAAYALALLWLFSFAFHKRMYSFLILSSPLFFNLCIVFLAPAIQRTPRYAFPIIYSLPVILSYYLYLLRGLGETNTEMESENP